MVLRVFRLSACRVVASAGDFRLHMTQCWHAGSFFDLSNYVTHTVNSASTPAPISLISNAANSTLLNHISPSSSGIATIGSAMGDLTVDVQVTVLAASTTISSVRIQDATFSPDGVVEADPSYALCSDTFRGLPGDKADLRAVFTYTDEDDGLSCPFELPIGDLAPSPRPLHDVSVLISSLTSSGPAITIDAGHNLELQQSSASPVQLTATVNTQCNPANISDAQLVYANLEAEAYQVDLGHRCGAPVGKISDDGTTQRLLAIGDTEVLPVRLSVPVGATLQSITIATTFDDTLLEVNDVTFAKSAHRPDHPDANWGDTNAVRYNGVWSPVRGDAPEGALDLFAIELQV
jgi:hypothetical protein